MSRPLLGCASLLILLLGCARSDEVASAPTPQGVSSAADAPPAPSTPKEGTPVASKNSRTRTLDDIVIPLRMPTVHPPPGLTADEQEAFRNRALLEANGHMTDRPGLHRASSDSIQLIRFAALHLLHAIAEPVDKAVFESRLSDENALVKVYAAGGLARLGDARGLAALRGALAPGFDDPTGDAAPFAASLLAAEGDPRGYGAVLARMKSSAAPHVALARLRPFVAHQGAQLADGVTVDVWGQYRAALASADVNMQGVALGHLEALEGPEVVALLEGYAQRTPVPPLQAQAKARLEALKP